MSKRRSVLDRFIEKVRVIPCGGCREWEASLNWSGYGQFKVDGRHAAAHRWSYENEIGPIPNGLVIDHLCRNRACVNPAHLEVVTQRENVSRGRGNWMTSQTQLTHCHRGHLFSEENTYVFRGHRRCLTCKRETQRVRRSMTKANQ